VRIHAEAEAAESLVKTVKAAEAAAEAAKHRGREVLANAEAELEAADKIARSKIRLAEGHQAEEAAEGLAKARVKEADAMALEKAGMVEARVTLEKLQSAATGEERLGLAKVKVAEAEAHATEKKGLADALVIRERLQAEAIGQEQKGLAHVRVEEAEASAILKKGTAEAEASRLRFSAEAQGLAEKAAAMKALDPESRAHEEFRYRLSTSKDVAMQTLETKRQIAEHQAQIMAKAFEHAKIQIVGGDGKFFDRFVNAVSMGQAVDTTIDQSETLKTVLGDYLNGSKDLTEDLKGMLTRPAVGSETLKNLTLSAVLGRLASGADDDAREKIAKLAARAKDLGIDDLAAK
jgi:hypothetical protein